MVLHSQDTPISVEACVIVLDALNQVNNVRVLQIPTLIAQGCLSCTNCVAEQDFAWAIVISHGLHEKIST